MPVGKGQGRKKKRDRGPFFFLTRVHLPWLQDPKYQQNWARTQWSFSKTLLSGSHRSSTCAAAPFVL